MRENPFQDPLVASGGLLAAFGVPWLEMHEPVVCFYVHVTFSLWVSVLKFPLFTGTLVLLD